MQVSTKIFVVANFSTNFFVETLNYCFRRMKITFVGMQQHDPAFDPTPSGCFRIEELQAFQAFEACTLVDVNYYLWLNNTEADKAPYRFLYSLELVFERCGALLISSGEDSTAIRIISAETLIKTARELQKLHKSVSIQRVNCGAFPLWQPAIGQTLHAVRLSRDESGLYLNDALVLDFDSHQIMVALAQREGLEVGDYRH